MTITYQEITQLINRHLDSLKTMKKLPERRLYHSNKDYLNECRVLFSLKAQKIYFDDALSHLKVFLETLKNPAEQRTESQLQDLFGRAMSSLQEKYENTQFSILVNPEHPANQLCLAIFNKLYQPYSIGNYLNVFFQKTKKKISFNTQINFNPRTGRFRPDTDLSTIQASLELLENTDISDDLVTFIICKGTVLDVKDVTTPHHLVRLKESFPEHYAKFYNYTLNITAFLNVKHYAPCFRI